MTVTEKLRRLQQVNVRLLASQALKLNEDVIADLTREQLIEGRDSLDMALRRYASLEYAKLKQSMNPKPGLGNPDLYLTGATHRSIKIVVTADTIKVNLNDVHGLEEKYKTGMSNPFLLGKMSKTKLVQNYLQRSWIETVKNAI